MAGNKMALELDSPPNILIKTTLLAWMGLPVEWADWDRHVADNPTADAPAQLTLDDALRVNTDTGEIVGARCGGCQYILRFNGVDYDDCVNPDCPYNAEADDADPNDIEIDDDEDPDEC